MKVYTTIGLLFGMLLFSSIAQGQDTYKKYMCPNAPFQIDTVLNIASNGFTSSSQTNHIWLNSLNSAYIDSKKNNINAATIPAHVPLNKNSLLNPYSAANQIIGALVPFGSYYPNPQHGQITYYPLNKSYQALPYGYPPYNVKAIASPYYMLPKF
jgi:carbohydrate-binding DOMON domain-containing protein